MHIQGTITYETLSGGFWGIISDEGRRFRPIDGIPEEFQHSGLKVKAEVEPADTFSIFMWGTEVKLIRIERAEGD